MPSMGWRWLLTGVMVGLSALLATCGDGGASAAVDSDTGLAVAETPQATPPEPLTPEPTRSDRVPTPSVTPQVTPTARPTPVPQPLSAAGCKQTFKAGDSVQTINSSGGTRSYRLHVPKQYKTGTPMALVLNFHGYGQSAAQQEKYSGLNAVADTQGFLVVTPEGSSSPQGWNIVGVYDEDGVDDVGFVRDMLSVLSNQLCIDQARIYATGHSNGGEMASQLACMLPNTIAAVAPVSGAVWQGCDGRAFPIISFQGTADQNVLYDWSASAMADWAQHNRCSGSPTVTQVTAHVSRQNYQKCQADVVFYTIDGGGHTWPGSKISGGAGPVTTEINASNLIWTFFLNHPKK